MIQAKEVQSSIGLQLELEVHLTDPQVLRDGEDSRMISRMTVQVSAEKLCIEIHYPTGDGFGAQPSRFEGRHVQRYVLLERALRVSGANLVDGQHANDRVNQFLDVHLGALRGRTREMAVC